MVEYPARASWREYSLPIPSDAPVIKAHDLEGDPNVRSCGEPALANMLGIGIRSRIKTYRLAWKDEEAEEEADEQGNPGEDGEESNQSKGSQHIVGNLMVQRECMHLCSLYYSRSVEPAKVI